ncbi:MAG: aminotransferase class III-fold pyridoxal phosphate-dependent enzyme [Chitinophagales bacterium]|nr:aminotransferase class III-fold pyridoxal phosphate-dependent enzyme [Chitinophagales bacterium]
MRAEFPKIEKSLELYHRAKKLMHPITQTLAKGPGQFTFGVSPIYVESAKGARITDVDGNEYLDYCMGIGPISLGYAYDKVDNAIKEQLEKGITFSLMHRLELEVAEKLHEIIPNAESIRISKQGADVCSAAVRIARAFTKRKKVAVCGYHGWHDWYIGTTTRDAGIPREIKELTTTIKYNDLDSVKMAMDADLACVIIEPVVFEEPNNNFLHHLQELCQANGTLLIFDEMWTGFRLALGGAQEYFGVKPDLAVYSKACANGMPIAFLTGRDDVMSLFETDVFYFTTFGGEALSLAATLATIEEMKEKNVPKYLNDLGASLMNKFKELIGKHKLESYISISGYPCRSIVNFIHPAIDALVAKTYLQQELIKRGIYFS